VPRATIDRGASERDRRGRERAARGENNVADGRPEQPDIVHGQISSAPGPVDGRVRFVRGMAESDRRHDATGWGQRRRRAVRGQYGPDVAVDRRRSERCVRSEHFRVAAGGRRRWRDVRRDAGEIGQVLGRLEGRRDGRQNMGGRTERARTAVRRKSGSVRLLDPDGQPDGCATIGGRRQERRCRRYHKTDAHAAGNRHFIIYFLIRPNPINIEHCRLRSIVYVRYVKIE